MQKYVNLIRNMDYQAWIKGSLSPLGLCWALAQISGEKSDFSYFFTTSLANYLVFFLTFMDENKLFPMFDGEQTKGNGCLYASVLLIW